MKIIENLDQVPLDDSQQQKSSRFKTIAVIAEIAFVVILLICWFVIPGIRESKNLWVLFFYNFPSQFLIAIVPHEPVYFYFAKFYPALTVTLVAVAGTVLTEYINYFVFQYFMDFKLLQKALANKYVKKLIDLFNKAPFIALFVAGLTPIPFYPFRFIAVFARYPVLKYLAAVFVARSLRFYIFALFGKALDMSDGMLLAFFGVLILITALQFLHSARKIRKNRAVAMREAVGEPLGVKEAK